VVLLATEAPPVLKATVGLPIPSLEVKTRWIVSPGFDRLVFALVEDADMEERTGLAVSVTELDAIVVMAFGLPAESFTVLAATTKGLELVAVPIWETRKVALIWVALTIYALWGVVPS
jgi:hypothetical protein